MIHATLEVVTKGHCVKTFPQRNVIHALVEMKTERQCAQRLRPHHLPHTLFKRMAKRHILKGGWQSDIVQALFMCLAANSVADV